MSNQDIERTARRSESIKAFAFFFQEERSLHAGSAIHLTRERFIKYCLATLAFIVLSAITDNASAWTWKPEYYGNTFFYSPARACYRAYHDGYLEDGEVIDLHASHYDANGLADRYSCEYRYWSGTEDHYTNSPAWVTIYRGGGAVSYFVVDKEEADQNCGCSKSNQGNPINPFIGNKFATKRDITISHDLKFMRYYNSHQSQASTLGVGWRDNYSASISLEQESALPDLATSWRVGHGYSNIQNACVNGWNDIKTSVTGSWVATATASLTSDNRCKISYSDGRVWKILPIMTTQDYVDAVPLPPDTISTIVKAKRPDGRVIQFAKKNGVWVNESGGSDSLVEQTDGNGLTTGWQYTTANKVFESYNADGKLTNITDHGVLNQTLSYDDAGYLQSITDAFNRSLSFSYDAQNRIHTVTDPDNNVYTYAYDDASNNLISVTYPDGKVKSYIYNESTNTSGANLPNALTGIVDENNDRYATYQYDPQGRAISTEHAGNSELYSLSYTNNENTDVTDPLGTMRTFGFQAINNVDRITNIIQPDASKNGSVSESFTYDANGNLASFTDYNGIETTYTYDLTRNLETSRTEAYGTPQARTITTQWHPTFNLPTLITEPGKTTAYTYDNTTGLLLTKTITDTTTSTSRTWTYTYNAQRLLATVDGPRTDVSDVTTYGYDTQGNLTTITNALNQGTHITSYDANGHPLTIVDPNGVTTTLTYASRGWLTSRTVSDGTTTETTHYDYDGVGQLTKITLPDNSNISYTYDAAHRLTGIADSLGNHISYTLDAMGNRTKEDVYDPGNTLTQTRSHVYNALNKLAQDIGAQNQTTDYSYDNNGNLTSVSDPLNHTTTNGYDALNRLVQVTDPNNGITQYSYDTQDHLTSVTDPRNLQTTYDYNALDDLDQQVSPDTGTTTNNYDAAGNIITATDARGVVTEYAYDALNRLISKTYPTSPTDNITYSYDQGTNGIGRLTAIVPADGNRIDYRYDGYGNVIEETRIIQGVTFDTRYTYDTSNRLATITYPSGRIVAYARDTQGRISAITIQTDAQAPLQTVANQISYQPFGPVAGLTYGNGQVMHMTYNLDGRITGIRDDGTNGAIDDNTLDYDPAGDITTITDVLNNARNQTYTYDALQRLTQAVGNYGQIDYRYDSLGNRTSRNLSQGTHTETKSYTYDTASNRLQQISRQIDGVSGTRQFGYDATGNIITDALDTDTFTFTYNSANRLTAVGDMAQYLVNPLGQREFKHIYIGIPNDANGDGVLTNADIKYVRDYIRNGGAYNSQYDCDNNGILNRLDPRCMRQTLNAQRKGDIVTPQPVNINMAYTYDTNNRLLQEYNVDSGQVDREYIYLAGRLIAVITGGSLYFIHTDLLNTPRVITDNTDKIIWRWDSDPFGTAAANDDPDMDGIKFTYNLRFPGQYYDQETGLNYNYFRDYDPSTGRYVESDPIGLVGGLNTYTYVQSNPLSLIDPQGRAEISASLCVAYSVHDASSTVESVRALLKSIKSINEQIKKLEDRCSLEKQPDWYREYINKLKREALKLTANYAYAQRYSLIQGGLYTLACSEAALPVLP